MARITVTKEFIFDCAHMLAGHEGLCKNVHGHTYKVHVTVARDHGLATLILKGPSKDMVVDFKDLKEILNTEIFSKFDHAFIFNMFSEDKGESGIVALLQDLDMKICGIPGRPTAEFMCGYFMHEITRLLMSYTQLRDVSVLSIKVWETPTSYAEVLA